MDNLNNKNDKYTDEKDANQKEKKLTIVKGNSKELNVSKVKDTLAFETEEVYEEDKNLK